MASCVGFKGRVCWFGASGVGNDGVRFAVLKFGFQVWDFRVQVSRLRCSGFIC